MSSLKRRHPQQSSSSSSDTGGNEQRAKPWCRASDVPAPPAHTVRCSAKVIFAKLLVEKGLVRCATSKEPRIGILVLAIELANVIELWPPEVDDIPAPARSLQAHLKLRRGQTKLMNRDSTETLAGSIGEAIGKLDDSSSFHRPAIHREQLQLSSQFAQREKCSGHIRVWISRSPERGIGDRNGCGKRSGARDVNHRARQLGDSDTWISDSRSGRPTV